MNSREMNIWALSSPHTKRRVRTAGWKARWLRFSLVAIALAGCALQPVESLVADPIPYYRGKGYSVIPPQGKGWRLLHHDTRTVHFARQTPHGTPPSHTLVAAVMVMKPPATSIDTAAEFPPAIEQLLFDTLSQGRFRLIDISLSPYSAEGDYCTRYDLLQKERGNPIAHGLILEITAHGFICLDKSADFMVHAFYSERKTQGSASLLDDTLEQQVEGFLANVEYTPFH